MMCKKIILWGISICFTAMSAATAIASDLAQEMSNQSMEKQEEKEKLPDGEGEILLIHRETPGANEIENIGLIADGASRMSRSLDFGTTEQCKHVLGQYDFIICYGLEDREEELAGMLRDYEGHVMILGTSFGECYFGVEGQKNGMTEAVSYEFSNGERFEELVQVEKLLFFMDTEYERGMIQSRYGKTPLFSQVDGVRFCPLTDFTSNVLHGALLQEMTNWLWIWKDQPTDYPQYLVLDQIYPFMPWERLLETIDLCVEAGVPFVMSVMPVYQNESYPAMDQFCQVLRYGQAHGGAVILHNPFTNGRIQSREELYKLLTDVTLAYIDHGVYPLGIQVPRSWTEDKELLEVLKRYRTVFVYEDGQESSFCLEDHRNLLYYNYHQLVMPVIELDHTGLSYLTNYPSVVYVDSQLDTVSLKEKIQGMKHSFVPLKSLWDLSHSVWGDGFHLNYEDRILTINGEQKTLDFHPEPYKEDFNYERGVLKRVVISLESQNKGLIALTAVSLAVFGGLIIYARVMERNSFLTSKKRRKNRR